MKAFDRTLQRWRIGKIAPHLAAGGRVLDVGCADGALFRQLGDAVREGVGVDPDLPAEAKDGGRLRFVRGKFPDALSGERSFDSIAMLAILEHMDEGELRGVADACRRLLRPGGRVVATVPSPLVDPILHVLAALRIIDGMALHEHHEMDPRAILTAFEAAGMRLLVKRRFQLGLNNLYVFENPPAAGGR